MKNRLFALASLIACLVLPSCFQSEITIHLNKDGSGTLVEDIRLGKQMLEMIDQMAANFGGKDTAKSDPVKDMVSEEKAKTRAAKLGDGVTVQKIEPVNIDGNKGARVTYAFKDINQLKISADEATTVAQPQMNTEMPKKTAEPLVFKYADGKLTVQMPDPNNTIQHGDTKGDMTDNNKNTDNSQDEAAIKQMFGDMKFSMKLVIEPGIRKTNATHREDKTITLMEMDMAKLLKQEGALKKLSATREKDPITAMNALKGIDGIKIETNQMIEVEVQ